jgi:hypothetical protein
MVSAGLRPGHELLLMTGLEFAILLITGGSILRICNNCRSSCGAALCHWMSVDVNGSGDMVCMRTWERLDGDGKG